MNLSQRYKVNTPTVTAEVFDDEVVIIHLERGVYYSLAQSGAEIWKLLQAGADLPEIAANFATYTNTNSPDEVAAAVQQFVAELATEQLLVLDHSAPRRDHPRHAETVLSASQARHGGFVLPSLNKYTDMQDLLLLDPIHDVTESGWPHVKSP